MRVSLFILALGLAAPAAAQTAPTITAADLPVVGDTLRLSQALALPAGATAFTLGGANQTWSYAGLAPASQRVESYVSVASAATGLQALAFGPLGGANRATLAAPRSLPAAAGAALPVTDIKEFFNLSASDFRSVGFGATYGGAGLPVTYASQARQDVLYRFPLAFGGATQVSYSYFEVAVPGTATFSQRRQRTTVVDGWGTVTTPFGTFQALRVVATLTDHDSLAVGTTPAGPATLLPTQREYQWLAKGVHVPVLTITTTEVDGTQQVTAVEYRDSYRRLTPLAARSASAGAALSPYPNPLGAGGTLHLRLPGGSGPATVTATDLLGRRVLSRQVAGGSGEVLLEAASFGGARGVLLLTVQTSQGTATCRVVRE